MTTTLDPTLTVGELVTENPARTRVFEDAGIDYCCGGGRTLAEACSEVGADHGEVAAALDRLDAADDGGVRRPEWADLGPAALASHIQATHHAYLWDELPRLEALGRKVLAAHGGHHPELGTIVATVHALRAELEPHLAREEEEVFPACRRLRPGVVDDELAGVVALLVNEHDAAGAMLDQLRGDTGGFTAPADGCASYTAFYAGLAELDADTRLHVHKENNLLFPALVAWS